MSDGGPDHDRRRAKALLFLLCCAAAAGAPHVLDPVRAVLPSLTLAGLLGGYSLRTLLLAGTNSTGSAPSPAPAAPIPSPAPDATAAGVSTSESATLPSQAGSAAAIAPLVDVVVAARDEQAVISRLVSTIVGLRWPEGRLRLWIVDDGSEDRTPELLAALQRRHPLLTVLRRSRSAGGGKSAALNLVLRRLEGRWMLVLDADAELPPDLLERLIPQEIGRAHV